MAIKIWENNGRTAPILVCDICDTPIDDAGEGAAVFKSIPNGSSTKVLHVHKKGCHNKAEMQLGGRSATGWQELKDHLNWLMKNVDM